MAREQRELRQRRRFRRFKVFALRQAVATARPPATSCPWRAGCCGQRGGVCGETAAGYPAATVLQPEPDGEAFLFVRGLLAGKQLGAGPPAVRRLVSRLFAMRPFWKKSIIPGTPQHSPNPIEALQLITGRPANRNTRLVNLCPHHPKTPRNHPKARGNYPQLARCYLACGARGSTCGASSAQRNLARTVRGALARCIAECTVSVHSPRNAGRPRKPASGLARAPPVAGALP